MLFSHSQTCRKINVKLAPPHHSSSQGSIDSLIFRVWSKLKISVFVALWCSQIWTSVRKAPRRYQTSKVDSPRVPRGCRSWRHGSLELSHTQSETRLRKQESWSKNHTTNTTKANTMTEHALFSLLQDRRPLCEALEGTSAQGAI